MILIFFILMRCYLSFAYGRLSVILRNTYFKENLSGAATESGIRNTANNTMEVKRNTQFVLMCNASKSCALPTGIYYWLEMITVTLSCLKILLNSEKDVHLFFQYSRKSAGKSRSKVVFWKDSAIFEKEL